MARLWADLRAAVKRVTHPWRPHFRDQDLQKSVRDFFDDDEALGSDAALPAVNEARGRRPLRRLLQFSILENDEGVAPSQLEHGLLDLAARLLRDLLPALSLPVSVTARMRGSAMRAGTRQAVTRAARKTPWGNPASQKISSICSAQRGTFEACFNIAVFPAMSAGAAKRKTCQKGKFHGMMASTGPSGSNRM